MCIKLYKQMRRPRIRRTQPTQRLAYGAVRVDADDGRVHVPDGFHHPASIFLRHQAGSLLEHRLGVGVNDGDDPTSRADELPGQRRYSTCPAWMGLKCPETGRNFSAAEKGHSSAEAQDRSRSFFGAGASSGASRRAAYLRTASVDQPAARRVASGDRSMAAAFQHTSSSAP